MSVVVPLGDNKYYRARFESKSNGKGQFITKNLTIARKVMETDEFKSGILEVSGLSDEIPALGTTDPAADAPGTEAEEKPSSPAEEKKTPAADVKDAETVNQAGAEGMLNFDCFEDAKDYVCDTYNVQRSAIRGMSSLMKKAEELNIKIKVNE